METLPIRSGGKVDLQALPPPGPAQGTEKPKATSGPAGGATVELLALIAAELLPEPKEAQAELLKGADFFSHGLTSLLAGRLASRVAEHFGQTVGVLDIMAHVLTPKMQAYSYDEGYLYPGPAVKNVPLSLAPESSQKVIAEFGRPEYADLIANNPIELPLKPDKMVVAFRKWDELVGAKRAK